MKIWIDLKVLLMASVLLTTLQGVVAKRSGLGRRAKTSSGRSYSGRSNQQHHYAPQPAPKPAAPPKSSVVAPPKSATNVAASAPKPAATATNQQPIGWNVGNGKHNPSAPVGPPPPYPGASHYHPGSECFELLSVKWKKFRSSVSRFLLLTLSGNAFGFITRK